MQTQAKMLASDIATATHTVWQWAKCQEW